MASAPLMRIKEMKESLKEMKEMTNMLKDESFVHQIIKTLADLFTEQWMLTA